MTLSTTDFIRSQFRHIMIMEPCKTATHDINVSILILSYIYRRTSVSNLWSMCIAHPSNHTFEKQQWEAVSGISSITWKVLAFRVRANVYASLTVSNWRVTILLHCTSELDKQLFSQSSELVPCALRLGHWVVADPTAACKLVEVLAWVWVPVNTLQDPRSWNKFQADVQMSKIPVNHFSIVLQSMPRSSKSVCLNAMQCGCIGEVEVQ